MSIKTRGAKKKKIQIPGYVLSPCNANLRSAHLAAAKRVLRYVQGTKNVGLTLGGNAEKFELVGYSDAAFGDNDTTGRSTCTFVFTLGVGAVSWGSKRQPIVVLSTTEAEYVAWTTGMMRELGELARDPILLFGDNRCTLSLANNPEFHARTKQINIWYHFIRSCVQQGLVDFKYLPIEEMSEDVFIKPLGRGKYDRFAVAMGLRF